MNTESVNSHTGSTSPGSPDDTGPHPAVRLWSRLRAVLVTLALTFVVLIVLEGLSGAVLFTLDTLRADREAAAQRISRHDPELGWVLLPDLQFPALWSPEAGLWTNEQSFRSRHAVPPDERVGTVRVICSGDSFTFGEGVANEDTWCSKLAGIDSRLDPVNLGQADTA